MKSFKEYSKIVNEIIEGLDYSNSRPSNLYEPITYALKGGGKHLRPILLLAFADAFGADISTLNNVAVAIEMFHNFTLVHDDIMDNSDTRHGKPAVWKLWGVPTAVLAGDMMLTVSDILITSPSYMSDAMKLEMLSAFHLTAVKVYRGQQYDIDFDSSDKDVLIDDYLMMIGLKTSALLGGACHLGAVAAQASGKSKTLAYEYGYQLGMAFQLQDDLLDTFGDPDTFGKPIGGDILNDKKTWLYITAKQEAPERMVEALKLNGQAKIDAVRAIYQDLDLPARCQERINYYTNKAIGYAKDSDMKPEAVEFFTNLATSLIGRAK